MWVNGFNHYMMQSGIICSGSYFVVYQGLAGSTHSLFLALHWLPTETAEFWLIMQQSKCYYLQLYSSTHTVVAAYSNTIENLFCTGPVKLHMALQWIWGMMPCRLKSCSKMLVMGAILSLYSGHHWLWFWFWCTLPPANEKSISCQASKKQRNRHVCV